MSTLEQARINHSLRARFELKDQQVFDHYVYKNLWWELDGHFFGFGDLRMQDIHRIQFRLEHGERFQGWDEYHGTPMQRTPVPKIRITSTSDKRHQELLVEARGDAIRERLFLG